MNIHCTRKLANKLSGLSQGTASRDAGFWDWHANLYTVDRRQCVLACHDQTRFVVFLAGLTKPDFANLGDRILEGCRQALERVGVDRSLIGVLDQAPGEIRHDTVCNRSVQGSLRLGGQTLGFIADGVDNVMSLDEAVTSLELSQAPVHVKLGDGPKRTWLFPIDAMQQALLACSQDGSSDIKQLSSQDLSRQVSRLAGVPEFNAPIESPPEQADEPGDSGNVISMASRSGRDRSSKHAREPGASSPGAPVQLLIQIELMHFSPSIWRDISVPSNYTLPQVHVVLQAAMGWMSTHLYAFRKGRQTYMEPDPQFPDDSRDARDYSIGDLLSKPDQQILYEYDFGDGWEHVITLLESAPAGSKAVGCRVISGQMACPPEDVGGPHGYAEFIEAMLDPEDPMHEQSRNWYGDAPFDPVYYSLEDANHRLRIDLKKAGL